MGAIKLVGANDALELVTSAAADLDVYADFMDATNADPPVVKGSTSIPQVTAITTATTTTIVSNPGAGVMRNIKYLQIRNKDVTDATDVTIQVDRSGTNYELYKQPLSPGEGLEFIEGLGWFALTASSVDQPWTNLSVAAQGPGFAADTYLTGSNVRIDALGTPAIGLTYICRFSVSKTGAGTATPIIQVRVGTAGAIGDTSRLSFTLSAGTAATDVAWFEVYNSFRAVGASAILQGHLALTSQPTTGFSSLLKGVQTTSGTFDSGVANSIIGVSVNGGTSAAWTVQLVTAELRQY
jgi:hypothetical protein